MIDRADYLRGHAPSYHDTEETMQEEMKCPKCGTDMKEYVTRFGCRNQNCKYEFKKYYPGGSAVGVREKYLQGRLNANT
jgi:hypothetical protein